MAPHPTNTNAIICVDLSLPVDVLINEDADTIRDRLYTSNHDLGERQRPGLKLLHINRAPFVTTAKALTEENAQRLGISKQQCLQHFRALIDMPDLREKLTEVYNAPLEEREVDPDYGLYSGGFLNEEERRWCDNVRDALPENLAQLAEQTQNLTLRTMLFRYRCRNYPHTLTADEMYRWQAHRQNRLTDNDSPATITLEPYLLELEQLLEQYREDPHKQAILRALYQYAQNL